MQKKDILRLKKEILDLSQEYLPLVEEIGRTIWEYAELAREEYHSARYLSHILEGMGFDLERGVGGFPTGFIGEFKNGEGPIIALLCEYDALPMLSSRTPGAPGHGCGHSLLSAGSLVTGLLLKTIMEKEGLFGTVRIYGTPSEEWLGSKQFYVRQGLFNDVDVAFSFHPHKFNGVFYNSHNAACTKRYKFYGKEAHAASMPEKGRSALDALELMNMGIQFLREHVTDDVRIHYSIICGGQAPNIVPAYAESLYIIRAQQMEELEDVIRRVDLTAKGAAMMTETEVKWEVVQNYANTIINETLSHLAYENVLQAGEVNYSEEDQNLAKELGFKKGIDPRITPLADTPGSHGGSSDEGDVSWVTSLVRISMRGSPEETINHSILREKQANFPAAYKAMAHTSGIIACTVIDLLTDADMLAAVKDNHVKALDGRQYPSDYPPFPEMSTFPNPPGIGLIDDKLVININETILLKDYKDVLISVYKDNELIARAEITNPDIYYEIELQNKVTETDYLVIKYQVKDQEVLLGYYCKGR